MRYIAELERKVQTLSAQILQQQSDPASENSKLKLRLQTMELRLQTMEQHVQLRHEMINALNEEIQRLKVGTGQKNDDSRAVNLRISMPPSMQKEDYGPNASSNDQN